MKDKITLWVVGLAIDKNKQAIIGVVSVIVGAASAYLAQALPPWAQGYITPELIGLIVVAVINFAVNFLASGPLKSHAAKLQDILSEMGRTVGLQKPPLVSDGKALTVTEEFADALKSKVKDALTPSKDIPEQPTA